MDQDGSDLKVTDDSSTKLAISSSSSNTGASGRGRIVLTLCNPHGSRGAYPRAIIPFPESLEVAAHAAIPAFRALLPPHTKHVALGLAVKTHDGDTHWAKISRADWEDVVFPGDEIGVFLESTPYLYEVPYTPAVAQSEKALASIANCKNDSTNGHSSTSPNPQAGGKKLVYIMCDAGREEMTTMLTTNSYEECRAIAVNHFKNRYWSRAIIQMEALVDFDGKRVWSIINDAASFARLLALKSEPITMRASVLDL